ncbi:hypothetical protein GO684_00710 [Wolbachia endosymbiont of Litomosoides brasiliensis]|uniref:TRP75-related protein n=1 Tax=Wolbachia endosymbiont of Litomosoides brasiliensis TaxID=1812117 RepID=UPI00158DDD26|nr:TRP75-related protein [Wolbachia endosymbiont of Litomosoides brasiliensis]NUY39263.1 hypothetical protein [Wolbachia endosymbiont of Litomosoides brasiliensis]
MLRFFFGVLSTLVFLVFSFFTVQDAEAKSKVKFSKKYRPLGNPGGTNFHEDEDFAESYKLYEKRRELLKKKKSQGRTNININKEKLAKKLKEKKISHFDSELSNTEVCVINDEEDAMVNQHGINIARLKGAVFIDQGPTSQREDEQHEGERQEGKEATSTQEKKASPISVTIKNAPSKRTYSHDSIADLNNVSSNDSDLLGSVADAAN